MAAICIWDLRVFPKLERPYERDSWSRGDSITIVIKGIMPFERSMGFK